MIEDRLSCCSVVAAESLTLFEQVSVAGKLRYLPFTQRILWLRESSTKLVLRHPDRV